MKQRKKQKRDVTLTPRIDKGADREAAAIRQDVGQRGYGVVDSHRQQAARCLHTVGRAHAIGFAPNCCGGWTVGGQEFCAGELCREVSSTSFCGYILCSFRNFLHCKNVCVRVFAVIHKVELLIIAVGCLVIHGEETDDDKNHHPPSRSSPLCVITGAFA